jgi:hypothetical protein
MTTSLALVHLIGALMALEVLGLGLIRFAHWSDERSRAQAMQDLSRALHVPLSDIEKPEHSARIVAFLSERFAPDVLDNRLSDLMGTMQVYWKWAGYLLQYGFLVVVMWQAMTQDKALSVYAWLVLVIALGVWAFSLLVSWLCLLTTGRYPGQARRTRNRLQRLQTP